MLCEIASRIQSCRKSGAILCREIGRLKICTSIDRINHRHVLQVYTVSKIWCYRSISLALAVPLAVLWGVSFACLVFCRVWCCVPCFRAFDIQLHCLRRFIETIARTCIAPGFEAVGRMCYHVRIRVTKATDDNA
jgi:Caveolin